MAAADGICKHTFTRFRCVYMYLCMFIDRIFMFLPHSATVFTYHMICMYPPLKAFVFYCLAQAVLALSISIAGEEPHLPGKGAPCWWRQASNVNAAGEEH